MKNRSTSVWKSLRIILSITGKDVLDALKNKTILTTLVSALFLAVLFTFLPMLSEDDTPLVFLADAGHSEFTAAIAASEAMQVRWYDSAEEMQADFVQRADRQLALLLPADFDQTLASGEAPRIQGYALNWVSPETVAKQQAYLEAEIAAIIGGPVQISMTGGTLYMLPGSNGGFLEAILIVVIVFTTGLVLVPSLMLEEKRTRTLEALLVSPASSGQIALAKTLTGAFYVSIFAVLLVALHASLFLQWGLAVGSLLLSILLSVGLGLLLGILIEDRQQLVVLTQFVFLPLLIGPILLRILADLLPAWLVELAGWLPTAVMFDLLRISFSNQSDPGLILPRLGVMAVCCLVLLGMSAWRIRRADR